MNQRFNDLLIRSSVFPAGTLLDSYYDRDVTRLSDRGLASNMIGDRWSEISSQEIATWAGTEVVFPDSSTMRVERVFRLDAIPQIARIASKRKLQNPDFIIAGTLKSFPAILAVDAKFSIDTAKPAQVSAETLRALLDVGDLITDLLPDLPVDAEARDGLFISPNAPLSHYVMQRNRGRLSVRVPASQVMLTPVTPVGFLKPLAGARLIGTLATRDDFRNEIRSNMLLAMYYFRLVRACYGAYADMTAPFFGTPVTDVESVEEIEQQTVALARNARSAWDVVLHWDSLAEHVRKQREAIHAAMPFPLANKDLRDRIMLESELRGVEAPSINSVRKRLGSWYRRQFDDRLGVIVPPLEDLASIIERVHQIATEVEPLVPAALNAIIEDVFASLPAVSIVDIETH